jgi:hypothetical protein
MGDGDGDGDSDGDECGAVGGLNIGKKKQTNSVV